MSPLLSRQSRDGDPTASESRRRFAWRRVKRNGVSGLPRWAAKNHHPCVSNGAHEFLIVSNGAHEFLIVSIIVYGGFACADSLVRDSVCLERGFEMAQISYPAVFMRGGTSKGLFFRAEDLPSEPAERERFILRAAGSPDPGSFGP